MGPASTDKQSERSSRNYTCRAKTQEVRLCRISVSSWSHNRHLAGWGRPQRAKWFVVQHDHQPHEEVILEGARFSKYICMAQNYSWFSQPLYTCVCLSGVSFKHNTNHMMSESSRYFICVCFLEYPSSIAHWSGPLQLYAYSATYILCLTCTSPFNLLELRGVV